MSNGRHTLESRWRQRTGITISCRDSKSCERTVYRSLAMQVLTAGMRTDSLVEQGGGDDEQDDDELFIFFPEEEDDELY